MARKNNIGRRPSGTPSTGRRTGTSTGQDIRIEEDDTLVDLVEVTEGGRDFFQRNRTVLIGAVVGLIFLVAGFLLYQTLIQKPAEREAAEQMRQAQVQFEQDSFSLALTNPGLGYPGFLDIIDNYGSTPSANLAKYYAAVSYLNLGKYDAALDFAEDFDAKGTLLPAMKFGIIGDAQSELNNMDAAIDAYEDAVDAAGENYVTGGYFLNKYGMLLMQQNRNDEALAAFQRLKRDYGASNEALEADKYIGMLEAR